MTSDKQPRPRRARRRVRTPTLLQLEAAECGAAALGILLAHHGLIVPLAELRVECAVSRDGSNALNMVRAARRYGLEIKAFSKEPEELLALEPPFIVFWNFNHFVVVEGLGARKVHINDPASGHRTVGVREFDESFTGVVLTAETLPEFKRGGHRPSVIGGLRRRFRGLGGSLSYAVLAGFLMVLPALSIPALTQVFLDDILIEGHAEWLPAVLVGMGIAVLLGGLLRFLQLVALRRMRVALSARMSAGFFWHLLSLPVAFYSQRFSGEIGDRTSLNDKVANVLSGQLAQTVIDVAMMVFYVALMLFYDVRLTLIGLVFAGLNFIALRWMSRRRVESNMRLLQEYGKVAGVAIAGLQNIESIKASGMEAGFFRRWAGHFAGASNTRQDLELADRVLGSLPGLFSSLATMLVLALGGLYVVEGHLTIGMLVAFGVLMMGFLRPVEGLVLLGSTMQELHGDLARLDDVLAHPGEQAPPADERSEGSERLRLSGRLELRSVTFGYNPSAPALVEDFDLALEPGRRVALVGGSGSGKTTLARLVCGLYQPWSGEILLDGEPRGELPSTLLASSLALVDQDVLLFAGSVRENLTLWDPTVLDAKLLEACEDAEILDRVRSLSGGLSGQLLEGGSNLSGGERQRLEIARALATEPVILVLDEATSALDAETERRIVERIALRGCTCLIVAHRLSTIRDCDEILVLDGGRVVERGTHEELWALGGAYAELLRTDEGSLVEVPG